MLGIKPTRRPSHGRPLKYQQPKSYSYDTNKYDAQYYFRGKTDSSYTGYIEEDTKLTELSHSTKVNTPLYTKYRLYEPQYETKSDSSIYDREKNTYNANEINSLLQTRPSPSLEYDVRDYENADLIKLTPRPYNYVTESQEIEKLENNFDQISVHDQGEYQKSIVYLSNNSQRQGKGSSQFDKVEQEKSAFNVDEPLNYFADVDSKPIFNVSITELPFQLDGPSIVPQKQVNARLKSFESQKNPGFDAIGVQPPSSINVKPFSLPIGPDPQACPCYLVESNNNTNIPAISTTPIPVIGQLGFIPVIFVPYCPGNETDSNKMKIMFPFATPVPYACNACATQDSTLGIQTLDVKQLNNINYLTEVLKQANLGFLNVPVKTSAERKRGRVKKTE